MTQDPRKPVVIFAGTYIEAGLLRSLLESEGIESFLRDDAAGTVAPWWVSPAGVAAVKVVVASEYEQQVEPIVAAFRNTLKD